MTFEEIREKLKDYAVYVESYHSTDLENIDFNFIYDISSIARWIDGETDDNIRKIKEDKAFLKRLLTEADTLIIPFDENHLDELIDLAEKLPDDLLTFICNIIVGNKDLPNSTIKRTIDGDRIADMIHFDEICVISDDMNLLRKMFIGFDVAMDFAFDNFDYYGTTRYDEIYSYLSQENIDALKEKGYMNENNEWTVPEDLEEDFNGAVARAYDCAGRDGEINALAEKFESTVENFFKNIESENEGIKVNYNGQYYDISADIFIPYYLLVYHHLENDSSWDNIDDNILAYIQFPDIRFNFERTLNYCDISEDSFNDVLSDEIYGLESVEQNVATESLNEDLRHKEKIKGFCYFIPWSNLETVFNADRNESEYVEIKQENVDKLMDILENEDEVGYMGEDTTKELSSICMDLINGDFKYDTKCVIKDGASWVASLFFSDDYISLSGNSTEEIEQALSSEGVDSPENYTWVLDSLNYYIQDLSDEGKQALLDSGAFVIEDGECVLADNEKGEKVREYLLKESARNTFSFLVYEVIPDGIYNVVSNLEEMLEAANIGEVEIDGNDIVLTTNKHIKKRIERYVEGNFVNILCDGLRYACDDLGFSIDWDENYTNIVDIIEELPNDINMILE